MSPRAGARWRSCESGLTLVELMVTLLLTSVVLGMVTTGAIALLRATNTIDVRTENVDHARLAISVLSRDLRAAAPPASGEAAFEVAEPRHARFTARLGDGEAPVLIDLRVEEDGRLVERETPPSLATDGAVSYDPADERIRYVASYVFNRDDEPVLSYGEPTGEGVTWFEGELTEAERRRVRVVGLELVIARDEEQRVTAQRIGTEVRIPNLRGGE